MKQSYEIEICLGSSCFSRGNREVVQVIRDYLRKNHLDDKVLLKGARCMDRCSEGPFLTINGKTFIQTTLTEIEKILDRELAEPGR
ncbi:MAG: (2Fe-2S) ferredoxin domain-containing protein [Bacteroidales bacterium]|nr:(2Fe-2S) ferredoxin domain-containing protein [Bacteroidales bacterium]